MSKNVILVMDSNRTFVHGFSTYFSNSDTEEVIVIDSIDKIYEYQYDYLLIDESIRNLLGYPDKRVFYLVDEERINSSVHVSRYQNAKQILNHLLKAKERTLKEAKSLMLFSMSGGSGKTIFSSGFCDAMEKLGKQTLYISYALCNDPLKKDIDLSLLIYYIHHNQELPGSVLKTLADKLSSPTSRINAFMNTPDDRKFLNTEIVTELNALLKSYAGEREMIIEIPWGSGDELKAISAQVNYTVLLTDNRHSKEGVDYWVNYYKKQIGNDEGFYIIRNKGAESLGKDGELIMPRFEEQFKTKGVEEWISKNLLTQWMK